MRQTKTIGLLLGITLSATMLLTESHATPQTWRQSYTLESQGNYRGALETLDTLSEGERQSYLYTLRRGWLLYLLNRFDESAAAYRRAATLSPAAVEPRLGELLPLIALRRWSEVETRAREVLHLDGENYLAKRRLALALYNLGRFDGAIDYYRQVYQRYPGDLEMLSGLGWCELRQGRRENAAVSFRAVLAVQPDNASAAAGLAAAATP